MPTVKFGDRFGIAFSGFGLDQHSLLEMCLELSLQRDEERGAIVTVPIGEAARYDLGIVDLNLHLRVARQRGSPTHRAPFVQSVGCNCRRAVNLRLVGGR